jgi:primosomal protein N' (replication factor Y)
MQILTVAPIVRGALQGTLTYFTKETMPLGAVIMVPIRTREAPALILESKSVSDAKSELKTSVYAVRKISRAKPHRVWNNAFLKAAEETARFSAQGLGETLLTITPKTILDAHIEGTLNEAENSPQKKSTSGKKILAIQSDTKTRLEAYQQLVRESFARRESVFICVPTLEDVERTECEVGHGIEEYTYAFHSGLTKKRLLEKWVRALEENHAILAIGTPQYLALPRTFDTIILDEEHSRSWKTPARPLIDMRIFAEAYATLRGSALIFGASILRPETHKRIHAGEIGEFNRINNRTIAELKTAIIDPRLEEKDIREGTGRRTVQIIGKGIRTLIEETQKNNVHTFLLATRKGLSPITACGDCGTIIRCKECDTPLVIHKQGENRIFSCHACGLIRVPEDGEHETCPTCTGWRLEPLGIGIERIEEEVAELFPYTPRFIFDGDHVKTRTQARKLIMQFEKSRGGILIGTPMAVPYLTIIEHAAIVSIDSLFAIPDFRMNERIFALILALREKTSKTLLVQTRMDDVTLLEQALKGDLLGFTENELMLRKAFSYPPYGTIIKITLRGKRTELPTEIERLKEYLADYAPIAPNSMAREPKNMFRMHIILKLALGVWINNTLLTKLRALPPQFTIEINPDHLL